MAGGNYKHGRNQKFCDRYAAGKVLERNKKRTRRRVLKELSRKFDKLALRGLPTRRLAAHIQRLSNG